MNPEIGRAGDFVRVQVSVESHRKLERLASWLREEAVVAGGLGPSEGAMVESRHIADSLLFAAGWSQPPHECWDLGSGVGLPGLVLAVVWPSTKMVLIDRSGKRCDLAGRAARVIGVDVTVRRGDISLLSGQVEAIVSRAAVPAAAIRTHLLRLLSPGGVAVVSGTGGSHAGFERVDIPAGILDRPSRLLMMRAP